VQRNVHFVCVNCYIFVNCSQIQHRRWTGVFGKAMKCRFQRCIVRTEILSTFHARVKYISVTKYATVTIGPMGASDPKIHPFALRHVNPYLTHEWLGWPHSPPQMTARSVTHFCTTTQQRPHWLQQDAPNSPPKLPFPFEDNHTHLIHLSLDQPHSLSWTASGSNHPFCHSTLSRQTNWLTDSQTDTTCNTDWQMG